MSINRREAIKKAAYFMGGSLTAPTIFGVLQGCSAEAKKPNWTPTFFTEQQALTVMEIAETILPATNTLGAKDLKVPQFIEEMVGKIYDRKDQSLFMKGLAAFEKEVQDRFSKSFADLDSDQKLKILNEKNDFISNVENNAEWTRRYSDTETPFFWRIKELTLVGYFTTEYGSTQILQYSPVPATFDGCMPIDTAGNGKTWAT